MRFNSIIRAGARATVKPTKKPTKPRTKTLKPQASTSTRTLETSPLFGIEESEVIEHNDESNDFTGRVHSESYSAENLTAAFDSLLTNKKPLTSTTTTTEEDKTKLSIDNKSPKTEFLKNIQTSTLSTIESYRTSILNSLKLDDPHGRIYSKNVRQMKEILGFEKWRKKLDLLNDDQIETEITIKEKKKKLKPERHPITRVLLPTGSLSVRKSLFDRPSLSDQDLTFKVLKDLWKLDELVDATVVVAYSGHPTLIDELLKLKNIRKVIAIEELPEYCLMYNEKWSEEIKSKRFFQIKNDGYWWESYSELEEEGLLDDVEIVPWNQSHPSLFFISQLPHTKRSLQFVMQLISFIPNRNWLFQYGRLKLGLITTNDLSERLTRKRSEKKYTRMTATADCLTRITSLSNLSTKKSISMTPNKFFPINLLTTDANHTNKIHEEMNPICDALLIEPLSEVTLSSEEFDCMTFLQRHMFIHSATSWVESISHSAAGASIMYDKLKAKGQIIPKSKTPRMMTGQEWINLSKCFNEWPFKPRTFENELELALDDSYNV